MDITLTVDDTGLVSTVTPTTQAISDPFAIGGIVLPDPSLTVTCTWPSRPQGKPQTLSFTLGGHVKLGSGQGALSCATTLSSVSGGPVLFDVALDADFSLGAFLAQCLTGNGANWPAGFIDFALLSGTRIYYYDEAADDSAHSHSTLDSITFQPRFNVDAQIRLTQVTSITLHGVLTVLTDRTTGAYTGVRGQEPDRQTRSTWSWRRSRTTQPARGPALHQRPGARHLGRSADHVPAARRDQLPGVGVSKGSDGGTIMKGTLTAAPLAPFRHAGPQLHLRQPPVLRRRVRHRRMAGFHLVCNLIDFVEAIKDLADTSGGSPCGTLGDFIVTSAYSSSFSVSPSVSVSGTNVVFAVTGTYAHPDRRQRAVRQRHHAGVQRADPEHDEVGKPAPRRGHRLRHRGSRSLPATC